MANTDPKGYFAVLGLQVDATEAAIRQAFRQQASKYHPDKNQSADAIKKFQAIQLAYRVLKDPALRARYLRDGASPKFPEFGDETKAATDDMTVIKGQTAESSTQTSAEPPRSTTNNYRQQRASTAYQKTEADAEAPPPKPQPEPAKEKPRNTTTKSRSSGAKTQNPIPCDSCGKISRFPRLIIFERVISLLFSWRHQDRKVLCWRCAERIGFRHTLVSLLFGWWGFLGPYYTYNAYRNNRAGGKFEPEANASMLAQHALGYVKQENYAKAYLIAERALTLTKRDKLRQQLKRLIERIGVKKIKGTARWDVSHSYKQQHLVLFVLVVGGYLAGFAYAWPSIQQQVMHWLNPLPEIVEQELPQPKPTTDAKISIKLLRDDDRIGEGHALLSSQGVYSAPNLTAPLVAQVYKYDPLYVRAYLDAGEGEYWYRVSTFEGAIGYVPEPELGFGNGELAWTVGCDKVNPRVLNDGNVIDFNGGGDDILVVENPLSTQVMVKFSAEQADFSLFMKPRTRIAVKRLKAGQYKARFAMGSVLHPECQYFQRDMRLMIGYKKVLVRPGYSKNKLVVPQVLAEQPLATPIQIRRFARR